MRHWIATLMILAMAVACGDQITIDYSRPLPDVERTSEYMAVFGDIQYLTMPTTIAFYKTQVEWLERNIDLGAKINCVLHTGDITETNDPISWALWHGETETLAKKTLYMSAIGDHDYTWHDKVYISDRSDTHFNEYMDFPRTLSKVVASFEPGHMENVVVENVVRGQRLYLLCLEFGPRNEVVEWANEYVSSHKDVKFILVNHEYLESGGGIRTQGLKCVARIRKSSFNTPTQLWDRLIKGNDNIVCVLCGHVSSLYALTLTKNDFGREVPQIEHNIQSSSYRFDNWLMLWEFPAVGDSASVSIVNTATGDYYSDTKSLFKFRYKY